jgi:hypothetical protein
MFAANSNPVPFQVQALEDVTLTLGPERGQTVAIDFETDCVTLKVANARQMAGALTKAADEAELLAP